MLFHSLSSALLFLASLAAASPAPLHARDNSVRFVDVSNSTNSTGGAGQVAAAGSFSPFGDIGVGCGVNWDNHDASYGGGLNAGSSDYGLGGGFKINPQNITIGLGIGINAANASANVQFSGTKSGHFEFVFESSDAVSCVPGNRDGKTVLTCKSAKKE